MPKISNHGAGRGDVDKAGFLQPLPLRSFPSAVTSRDGGGAFGAPGFICKSLVRGLLNLRPLSQQRKYLFLGALSALALVSRKLRYQWLVPVRWKTFARSGQLKNRPSGKPSLLLIAGCPGADTLRPASFPWCGNYRDLVPPLLPPRSEHTEPVGHLPADPCLVHPSWLQLFAVTTAWKEFLKK